LAVYSEVESVWEGLLKEGYGFSLGCDFWYILDGTVGRGQQRFHSSLALEIIDAFAIEHTGPVLDTGLGASEESNHVHHLRRCFTLLLGG